MASPRTGLRRHSRDPNYLGEIAKWSVFYLFAVAASGQWDTLDGSRARRPHAANRLLRSPHRDDLRGGVPGLARLPGVDAGAGSLASVPCEAASMNLARGGASRLPAGCVTEGSGVWARWSRAHGMSGYLDCGKSRPRRRYPTQRQSRPHDVRLPLPAPRLSADQYPDQNRAGTRRSAAGSALWLSVCRRGHCPPHGAARASVRRWLPRRCGLPPRGASYRQPAAQSARRYAGRVAAGSRGDRRAV